MRTQGDAAKRRRQRVLRRYYLKHRDNILKQQLSYRSAFLEDEQARRACIDDPRRIREVAGDDVIVCPGIKKSGCWRMLKCIAHAHLEKHFPGEHPARAFRAYWQLPWGFPLTSKTFSLKTSKAREGTRPAMDPALVRPDANKARKRTKWNRWALRDLREKAPSSVPGQQKVSDAQINEAYNLGLTAVEAGQRFGVRDSSILRRAERLGLDFGRYHRDKQIISKVLGAVRHQFRNAVTFPKADQVCQWLSSEFRTANEELFKTSAPFLTALRTELSNHVIRDLLRSPRTRNNLFPLAARIVRQMRGGPVAKPWRGGRLATKEQQAMEAKRLLRENPALTWAQLAQKVDPKSFSENQERAADLIRHAITYRRRPKK